MKKYLRTSFDLLKPLNTKETVPRKQQDQVKDCQQRPKGKLFHPGEHVLARNYGHGPKWVPATVLAQTGPVSYTVRTCEDVVWRRHVDQLLSGTTTPDGTLVSGAKFSSPVIPVTPSPTREASCVVEQFLQDWLWKFHIQNCWNLLLLHLFLTASTAARWVVLLPAAIRWGNGGFLGALIFSLTNPPAMGQNTPLGCVGVWVVHSIFLRKSDLYCVLFMLLSIFYLNF